MTHEDEIQAKNIARAVLKYRIHYQVTSEKIAQDVEEIYVMMTDLLLPALMSDRPYTVGRERVVRAIINGTYKSNHALHRILCKGMLKQSPYEYVLRVYQRLEAVKVGAAK